MREPSRHVAVSATLLLVAAGSMAGCASDEPDYNGYCTIDGEVVDNKYCETDGNGTALLFLYAYMIGSAHHPPRIVTTYNSYAAGNKIPADAGSWASATDPVARENIGVPKTGGFGKAGGFGSSFKGSSGG